MVRELKQGYIPEDQWSAPDTHWQLPDDPAVKFTLFTNYVFIMREGVWAVEYWRDRVIKLTWGGDLAQIAREVHAVKSDGYDGVLDKFHAEITANLANSDRRAAQVRESERNIQQLAHNQRVNRPTAYVPSPLNSVDIDLNAQARAVGDRVALEVAQLRQYPTWGLFTQEEEWNKKVISFRTTRGKFTVIWSLNCGYRAILIYSTDCSMVKNDPMAVSTSGGIVTVRGHSIHNDGNMLNALCTLYGEAVMQLMLTTGGNK